MTPFRAPLLAIAIVLVVVGTTMLAWSCHLVVNAPLTHRMAHDGMVTIARLAPSTTEGRRILGMVRQYEWLHDRHGETAFIVFVASLLVLFTSAGTATIALHINRAGRHAPKTGSSRVILS